MTTTKKPLAVANGVVFADGTTLNTAPNQGLNTNSNVTLANLTITNNLVVSNSITLNGSTATPGQLNPNYGSSYLGSNTTNSGGGAYNSGYSNLVSFTIPSAGTWKIDYFVGGYPLDSYTENGGFALNDNSNTLVSNTVVTFAGYNDAFEGISGFGSIILTTTGSASYTLIGWAGSGRFTFTNNNTYGRTGVTWLQLSPATLGSTGYTGSSGNLGYTGSQGTNGTNGVDGYWGSVGYTGSQGSQGAMGLMGYYGSVGFTGSRGYTGSVGFTGSQGSTGPQGPTGNNGYNGSVGYTGSQGNTGNNGYNGSVGFTGSQGNTGPQGPTGNNGYNGSVGYTGSAGTSGTTGYTGSTGSPFTGGTFTGAVTILGLNETVYSLGNISGTITPNASSATIMTATLTGNVTISALTSPVSGQSMTLILQQDATGNRQLTSTMKFAAGVNVLSTSANAIDIMSISYIGSTYYASLAKGFK